MLSIQLSRFGDPQQVLEAVQVAAPKPGPGEVLVRMTSAGVNHADALFIRGGLIPALPMPAVPGIEGGGVVVECGPGAQRLQVGQRVAWLGILAGQVGSWRECFVAKEAELYPVPDEIPDQVLGQLTSNPHSAVALLSGVLQLSAGDWLLQTAAASQMGRLLLQLARARGVRTIAVVRRPEQRDELRALGADVALLESEDLPARAMEATGGAGVKAALDAVGGKLTAPASRSLSPGGTLVLYGVLSGEPPVLDPFDLISRQTAVRGFLNPAWLSQRPAERRLDTLAEVCRLVAAGKLTVPTAAEYPLADVHQALQHVARSGRAGKVVLRAS